MSEQSQKTTGIRDARTLGIPKMLLLGIQHMFAMFGATILVPILTNVYFEGGGTFGSGNADLCRSWNAVFPSVLQNEGSCIFRFVVCIFGWIFSCCSA